jgi:hypothetical protein
MSQDLTQRGMAAYEPGKRARARRLFALALRKNARDERAWFGLSQVVEGKTEVIAWRVAHLVRSGYVRADQVLAVTSL